MSALEAQEVLQAEEEGALYSPTECVRGLSRSTMLPLAGGQAWLELLQRVLQQAWSAWVVLDEPRALRGLHQDLLVAEACPL